MNAARAVEEDLKLIPGMGATMCVGSDAYPYYVSEVLPDGVVGLYQPKSWFDDKHPWEGGTEVVQPFDSSMKSSFYIKRRYGNWWKVERNGKPIGRFSSKWNRFSIGHASSYRDPSF